MFRCSIKYCNEQQVNEHGSSNVRERRPHPPAHFSEQKHRKSDDTRPITLDLRDHQLSQTIDLKSAGAISPLIGADPPLDLSITQRLERDETARGVARLSTVRSDQTESGMDDGRLAALQLQHAASITFISGFLEDRSFAADDERVAADDPGFRMLPRDVACFEFRERLGTTTRMDFAAGFLGYIARHHIEQNTESVKQ